MVDRSLEAVHRPIHRELVAVPDLLHPHRRAPEEAELRPEDRAEERPPQRPVLERQERARIIALEKPRLELGHEGRGDSHVGVEGEHVLRVDPRLFDGESRLAF